MSSSDRNTLLGAAAALDQLSAVVETRLTGHSTESARRYADRLRAISRKTSPGLGSSEHIDARKDRGQ